ncbi:hypothetical protein BU24DRAFT_190038 [Aaosphaeria arxii CBS 175.79]|uniref:Uncharacterized protein n=1 Tax=Aaosphaeria arxii CBS 175.79 TaxID=1450172 RepID=A0A6A5XRT9_9PLEO|nr:uncharacterized protein BU24DRAFT_190038 [Aaosphaeria arxii CBS 175.79]KAF2016008.1 hypothetical protein BU24DRAFT_190038 [Aaosphaeria arxii CBS 175.79]
MEALFSGGTADASNVRYGCAAFALRPSRHEFCTSDRVVACVTARIRPRCAEVKCEPGRYAVSNIPSLHSLHFDCGEDHDEAASVAQNSQSRPSFVPGATFVKFTYYSNQVQQNPELSNYSAIFHPPPRVPTLSFLINKSTNQMPTSLRSANFVICVAL